ncbi:hypothetical protein [Paraliomyxa miuraensis]|uniref:hypothetical protein n=1 Tax=Paraliomyxa miuraensis TaxID=376150 RepID=UPI002254523B|nr:hypothetical protein [Paraliomyxa miuraensis]MCX4240727.1 hypothetical protein [Paraliomyxa miuraensis]
MRIANWLSLFAVVAMLLASGGVWAGELKIGVEPLEVDGSGKLTDAGRAAAVTEVEAAPGNEAWSMHLHAQMDKRAAVGPLYVEIYRERNGTQLVAFRKEYPDYDGARYVDIDLTLERYDGFAPGQTVEIAFVQEVAGRTVKWAKSPLTLLASSVPEEPEEQAPAEDGEDGEDEESEDEDDEAEQAAAPPPPAAAPEPPPVTSTKRGCHLGGSEPPAWLAFVALLGLRRRRA